MMNSNPRRWFSTEDEESEIATRARSPFRSKRNVHSLSLSDNSEKRLKVHSLSSSSEAGNIDVSIETDSEINSPGKDNTSTPITKNMAGPVVSNQDLLAAINRLDKKVDNLTLSMDQVTSDIHDLKIENQNLKKEVDELKKEN